MTVSRRNLLFWGAISGLLAAVLAYFGNPKNMAICIACFVRDVAGSLRLHTAAPVQYFRPEIAGLIIGAFLISVITGEFRPTGGSSPATRFVLGFIMVTGALIFLGCPTRMVLRMASGEIAAWIGLVGFIGGVSTGAFFLKKGFTLGKNHETKAQSGYALPIAMAVLTLIAAFTTWFTASTAGPGSIHAPFIISFVVALLFGIIAQRTRMCFGGAVRDGVLIKNFDLAMLIGGFFTVMLIYNIATGNFHIVAYGPIAHAQTLWNISGLYVVGFAAVLLGGCPLRQLILAGQGSSDSVVTVLGMLVGAACAHNFSVAASAAAPATAEAAAKAGGPGQAGMTATIVCIVLLFIIAYAGTRKKNSVKTETAANAA